MRYKLFRKRRFKLRLPIPAWLAIVLVVFVAAIVGGGLWADHTYKQDLLPLSDNPNSKVITIKSGSSTDVIAKQLADNHIIRSALAFSIYSYTHKQANHLLAGNYSFSPSLSVSDIISLLTEGKVATRLVTIYPGERIDQIRSDFINIGFSPASVDSALQPGQYSDLPVLAYKPANVNNLEGLLWPDSFEKDPNTDPSVIIRESLQEMGQNITPSVQAAFASEGLNTYQGITLASIVLQEVSKPTDQTQVAQVFLSRLKANMPLGSDVTANYGAIAAGLAPDLNYDSPYNTLIHTGLPPTPISNLNDSSLYAATHPANTNWLYFVAGDNGTTYFSTTLAQQQADKQAYCHKLCGD